MTLPPPKAQPEYGDTLLSSRARQQLGTVDWAATPIGPPDMWPQSLRTTLETMFSSSFPMCAAWGPDLTFFYNDAYAPILATRHPAAMGMRIAEVWPELWPDLAPLIRQAMSGEAVLLEDTHLVMTRNGYDEDTWWTFCYSPLRDDSGHIAGFLDVCSDSTAKVLNERRLNEERERLSASEQRFRALVNASSDVIFRASADWQDIDQIDVRGIVPDIHGSTLRWIDLLVPEEDRAAVLETVQKAIATKQPYQNENRVIRADGSTGWMATRAIPLLDADGELTEWFGMAVDVTERRRTDEHLRLVVNELNHRVRNNLAMVQSIAMQTFRRTDDTEQATTRFSERLVALARANDLLTGERGTGVDLHGILHQAVDSHVDRPERFEISGPAVELSAKSALALTLAAHELATNATKYGAWSTPDGVVAVTWTLDPLAGGARRLQIEWRERGGPPVRPPTRRGFGSRLIERGLSTELNGAVTLAFEPDGLVCHIDARLGAGELA